MDAMDAMDKIDAMDGGTQSVHVVHQVYSVHIVHSKPRYYDRRHFVIERLLSLLTNTYFLFQCPAF